MLPRDYPIRDDEAYYERLAIIECEPSETSEWMAPYRLANECAERTVYSKVATAALRGDWFPLWEWCARECANRGDEVAVSIMMDIRDRVQKEQEWRASMYGESQDTNRKVRR